MKFPKKQAQRLIPEYLLDYTTKLNESHPDPTESWGGGSGGSDYTAGNGIDITNNVISVDNTIAKKSEIPTNYVTTDTDQAITGDKIFTAPLEVMDGMLSRNTTVNGNGYFLYRDNVEGKVILFGLPSSKTGGTEQHPTNYTLATIEDIPSLDGYATQTWVENQGYSKFSGSYNDLNDKPDLSIYAQSSNLSTVATSGSYNDLTDKPTLATVATTGSYNDLTDKPTIPDTSNFVTIDTNQTIRGSKAFEPANLSIERLGTVPMKLIFKPDTFVYRTRDGGIDFNLPTSKPKGTADAPIEYTFATTDDIHNPTITFTQGGVSKGTITLNQSGDQTIEFDAGGGGGSTTNMVTTDTNQDITGEKTFIGTKRIKFKQHYSDDRLGFTGYDANGTEIGYLEMNKRDSDFTGSPTSNILGYWSSINSETNPSADVMLGFKYVTKDSDGNARNYRLVVPPRYNETSVTRYIPISVNGNTADNTGNINVPTETLVFTLADNSTVTVNVMTSATASTTNTL